MELLDRLWGSSFFSERQKQNVASRLRAEFPGFTDLLEESIRRLESELSRQEFDDSPAERLKLKRKIKDRKSVLNVLST